MIEAYVRNVHFTKIRKGKLILNFEYFVIDGWHIGKISLPYDSLTLNTVTPTIAQFLREYIQQCIRSTAWTEEEIRLLAPTISQFNMDYPQTYTRLRVSL